MALKHVLVHVDGSSRVDVRLRLALSVCRSRRARLTALFAEGVSLGASIVGRRSPDAMAAAARTAQAAFTATVEAAGVEGAWWALDAAGDVGRLAGEVAICCRYADLAVFGQPHAEATVPIDVLESAIVESGRPVLVVPDAGAFETLGTRVVIAWTGSRESARAVNDAVSLMSGAELVAILAFQQKGLGGSGAFPNLDIVGHLRAHGIEARYERVIVDDADEVGVADTALNRCADLAADLLVMGARPGHGFGAARLAGPARSLLHSMSTPVLLSA